LHSPARLALALLGMTCGCGPLNATRAINDAEALVLKAHAMDGDRLSPYETTSADLYLAKAREERGRAEYSVAEALAKKAAELAADAAAKASRERASPPAAGPGKQ
jgi:hypothetical protein